MAAHELTTYQANHLRVAFEHHAAAFYGPMIQASRAHVVMLDEQGLIPSDRAALLLRGLEVLAAEDPASLVFDGSVEDIYYTMEKRLAAACGLTTEQLDVQMARSRNDLDQGIFRMILREQATAVLSEVLSTARVVLDAADRGADVVITGYTHRRPAQPTTIGHVLAGYAEAVAGQAAAYTDLLGAINVSPLGACAFAGTDLDISSPRVAELLGFGGTLVNSYEAIVAADYLTGVGTLNARALATGSRLVRTLMDWLSWQWVTTPPDFTQGSTIMPQKRNPVVLEHLVSMAGATAADAMSVLTNVGAAWWEDSNNASTDVQTRLWDSNDKAERFFRLLGGFIAELEPLSPPSSAQIVGSGATTTAAADALTIHGVPFRAAHSIVGTLLRTGAPETWTVDAVRAAAAHGDAGELTVAAAEDLLSAVNDPTRVLGRAQADGPGAKAVRAQVEHIRGTVMATQRYLEEFVRDRDDASQRLDAEVRRRIDA